MPNLFAKIIPAQSAAGITLGLDFSTFKAVSDFQIIHDCEESDNFSYDQNK